MYLPRNSSSTLKSMRPASATNVGMLFRIRPVQPTPTLGNGQGLANISPDFFSPSSSSPPHFHLTSHVGVAYTERGEGGYTQPSRPCRPSLWPGPTSTSDRRYDLRLVTRNWDEPMRPMRGSDYAMSPSGQ